MSQTKAKRIVSKRGLCGGQPVIAGTRIRVQDVYVWHERHGLSADEIVSQFPQLSMADVYGALAYYWDHRDEMQRMMSAENEYVERAKVKYASPLREKLAGRDGTSTSVSSR